MKNRLAVNSTEIGTYGKATLGEPRTEADYFARRRFEAGRRLADGFGPGRRSCFDKATTSAR